MKSHQLFFQKYHQMYRPFINRLNAELAKHKLHSSQWSALLLLINQGPLTLVEIARHQNVEKPSISRTIQRLAELGYVESTPGKDKREKRIQLTKLGEEACSKIRVTIEEFELDALQGVSKDEQLAVIKVLSTVQGNLRKKE